VLGDDLGGKNTKTPLFFKYLLRARLSYGSEQKLSDNHSNPTLIFEEFGS